jgi:hypothetical protein
VRTHEAQTNRLPRSLTAVTWVAVLAPLLYGLLRALWALGLPVGLTEEGLDDIGVPSVGGSTYLLALAAASATVGLVTHRVALHDGRTLPRFLPLISGRRVPPLLLIAPAVLIALFLLSSAFGSRPPYEPFTDPDAFRRSIAPEGWAPVWFFWAQQTLFLLWGVSLSVATAVFWRKARRAGESHRGVAPAAGRS